ncbi:IS66 family transposase [Chitinophaga polysaccharea]|uniref:IS66 family transposase n=1 Tax=Chitinophaga polysaccharea TaxID=1293035 RepID=UPI003CD0CDD8
MSHARRYFVDALSTDKPRAEHALEQTQLLYAVERYFSEQDFNTDQRHQERSLKAVPIPQMDERSMPAGIAPKLHRESACLQY